MTETGTNESTDCDLGGQVGWNYSSGLSQASTKGLQRKVSVHLDFFKTLRKTIDLSWADSYPSSSLLPTYHGDSLSALSAGLTSLHKLHRDEFVFQWKTTHCLYTTHT